MALFSMDDIRSYLGIQHKQLEKRGMNFINSNKVLSIMFDRDLKHVQGRVQASKRPTGYEVWVEVKGNPDTWSSKCECARANARCAHRAALLIKAYKTVSCTSMPCRWSIKKTPEDDEVNLLSNMSSRKVFSPDYPPVDPAVLEQLTKDLLQCPDNSGAGVLFLLEDEPETSESDELNLNTRVPDAYDVLRNAQVMENEDSLIARLHVSSPEILRTAENSTGQANNPEWARIRRCRLTASKFGDILKAMKKSRPAPSRSLLEGRFVHRKLDGVKSILWGRTHKKTALKLFSNVTGQAVTSTGIWLHEDGFLGASPDGLLGEDSVIEVKCPYPYRNDDLAEVLPKKNSEKYVIFRRDGRWFLNSEHNYYHQVQACLHFTRREKAVLFIWTSRSYQAFPIMKDPEWVANISFLRRFYFDFFIPFLRSH